MRKTAGHRNSFFGRNGAGWLLASALLLGACSTNDGSASSGNDAGKGMAPDADRGAASAQANPGSGGSTEGTGGFAGTTTPGGGGRSGSGGLSMTAGSGGSAVNPGGTGGVSGIGGQIGVGGRTGAGASGGTGGLASGGRPATPSIDAASIDGAGVPVVVVDAGIPVDVYPLTGSADPIIPVAPPLADVCSKYAQAACARWKECRPLTYASSYGSDADCTIGFDRDCRVVMGAPGSGDTVALRMACTEAITIQDCSERAWFGLPLVCGQNRGSVMDGQACRSTVQCQGVSFCNVPIEVARQTNAGSGFRCGVCAPRAAVGKECSLTSGSACVAGSICVSRGAQSDSGICLQNKALGEACAGFDYCGNSARCLQGKCAAIEFAKLGESCMTKICDQGEDTYCDRLTSICSARPSLAKKGDYCGSLLDGSARIIACAGGLSCTGIAANGFATVCEPRGGFGSPCGMPGLATCANGMACLASTCQWAVPAMCM